MAPVPKRPIHPPNIQALIDSLSMGHLATNGRVLKELEDAERDLAFLES